MKRLNILFPLFFLAHCSKDIDPSGTPLVVPVHALKAPTVETPQKPASA